MLHFLKIFFVLSYLLSVAGSSGGEGALIAYGGSPVGIGTDVGGSIRLPSVMCGCYGIKVGQINAYSKI